MFSAISFGVFCRLAPFDEGDHPVDEALARLLRDPDDDAIGEHDGATGHRGTVTSGFPDHRRGFTRDGGFVHGGNALYDIAVAGGDGLAGFDHHVVAQLQQGGSGDLFLGGRAAGGAQSMRRRAMVDVFVLRSVSA